MSAKLVCPKPDQLDCLLRPCKAICPGNRHRHTHTLMDYSNPRYAPMHSEGYELYTTKLHLFDFAVILHEFILRFKYYHKVNRIQWHQN